MLFVVFGGSGFVGSTILTKLCEILPEKATLVSISRKNQYPSHLKKEIISRIKWKSGDALKPQTYEEIIKGATGVISCVGSPPVPTFSIEKYNEQYLLNGQANINIIEASEKLNVERFVLISANVPSFVAQGYRLGKKEALEAALKFTKFSAVLQPSGIYGPKYNKISRLFPLEYLLSSISVAQRGLEDFLGVEFFTRLLQNIGPLSVFFEPLVSVHSVASCAVELICMPYLLNNQRKIDLLNEFNAENYVIPNRRLARWPIL